MRRHLWDMTARMFSKGEHHVLGISNSDPKALVEIALKSNATAIFLSRGRKIKGALPTVNDVRKIYRKYKTPAAPEGKRTNAKD